jgi:predicted esterase
LKRLQEIHEIKLTLNGHFDLSFIENRPTRPKLLILLLHGLNERGLRIYRKLINYLPTDAHVIAPNGPYPLPRPKAEKLDFGHAWYFYDKNKDSYPFDQKLALSLLISLLENRNEQQLPVTIIGFSQGGYLAPLLGHEIKNTTAVIGIGCEFRSHFFMEKPSFRLISIHGENDEIIPASMARAANAELQKKGIAVDWHSIDQAGHEINNLMAMKVGEILNGK